ncbi:MAG: hypothetical protein C4526_04685 [Nitrospiraceae bacterium]|nr:MAG: hypothetical protein C4526_04685 [Nitrospiraceae bacterium]
MPADKKSLYNFIFIALLFLLIFLLQYTFRSADDNRLTSWQWTFAHMDLMWFIPLLILGIIFAYLLSISPFYKSRPALFLFIISFGLSAIFWSEPEVIVDTSRYFTQAKHLEIYGIRYFFQEWGREIFAWTDTPLVSFIYGVIFRFSGESRAYIQIFTTFLFSMTVVLTFYTGKILWDEETGFSAGALLLGIPYLFSQVPLMLTDVPTMFFLTLSIYTFCKAVEKGGIWIVLASLAVFSAVFSKYSTWMMLSVLPVIWVVYLITCRGNPQWLPSSRGGRGAGTGACPYRRGISVAVIAGALVAAATLLKFDVISQQIKFLQEYQAPGLKRWGESFVSTFLFQVHPLITLAALYSVYEAVKRRDLKYVIICWLILLVIVFQIKRSRYVMVVFPMLTLMASYGLQKIRIAGTRRFIIFGVIFSALAVAIFSYLPFLQKNSMVNIKSAGEFLDSAEPGRVRVFTIPSSETSVNLAVAVPVLDLYLENEIYYQDAAAYSLPYDGINTSPLRFTWEFKTPRYYDNPPLKKGGQGGFSEQSEAIAVISNGHVKALPDYIEKELKGYSKSKDFDTSEGIFGFRPFVTVYLPEK